MFRMPYTELGIDLGSSNTRIFRKDKGIVLNEPTIIAMREKEVVAAGSRAYAMIGRTPSPMRAVRPIKGGAVADLASAEILFSHFIKQVLGRGSRLLKPLKLSICVPYGASELEKHALAAAARAAGSAEIRMIDSAVAAANGMLLNAADARGRLVVDMGSSFCSCSIVSLNGVVAHRRAPGGDYMDSAISDVVREKYKVLIGESTSEYLKQAAGSIRPRSKSIPISVRGRSITDGLPVRIEVDSSDITEAILPIAQRIVSAVFRVYQDAPAELAADISEDGIYLTGGLSMLHGMTDLVTEVTGIRAHITDRPFTSAAEGSLATAPLTFEDISLGTA